MIATGAVGSAAMPAPFAFAQTRPHPNAWLGTAIAKTHPFCGSISPSDKHRHCEGRRLAANHDRAQPRWIAASALPPRNDELLCNARVAWLISRKNGSSGFGRKLLSP